MNDQDNEPWFKLKILTVPHVAELETEGKSIEELIERFNKSDTIRTFYKKVLLDLISAQTDVRTLTIPTPPALDGNEAVEGAESAEEGGKPKRHRRTKAQIAADEAAAAAELAVKVAPAPVPAAPPAPAVSAPAPMPVPAAPPPPLVGAPTPGLQPPDFVTLPTSGPVNAHGVPVFLDRAQNGIGTAPAPPPPPAPPPMPTPPVCTLAPRVIENLKARGESPELLTWLAGTGICTSLAKWSEALDVIAFTTDDKLRPIATALSVSS